MRPHPPRDQLNLEVAGGSDKDVHLAEEALQELEWCLDQVLLDTDFGLAVTIPSSCDSQCDFHTQLEGMEVNKSVANMAANKFKNMLNRSYMTMK